MSLINSKLHLRKMEKLDEKKFFDYFNCLKNQYQDIKDHCLESFKHLYCVHMDVSFYGSTCDHINNSNIDINMNHFESVMCLKFFFTYMDKKMDYYTYNESAKNYVQQSEFIKTNLVHNGPQTSTYRHSNANSKKLDQVKSVEIDNISDHMDTSNEFSAKNVEKDIRKHIEEKQVNNFTSGNITLLNASPKHDLAETLTRNPEEDIDEIFQSLDMKMAFDTSDEENINICKSNLITKEKINPIQKKSVNVEKKTFKSDLCLKNSSSSARNHSTVFNKKCTKLLKSKKTSKIHLETSISRKRSNSDLDDFKYLSKKKKLKFSNNLSTLNNAIQNINLGDESNSVKSPNSKKGGESEVKKKFKATTPKSTPVKSTNDSTKIAKDMYTRNSKGETLLHAACVKGNSHLVVSFLKTGFNPNQKDNAGWTPLHEAVKIGHLHITKLLIQYGAYLNVPGFEYESPLYTAIKYEHFDIAKLLLQYGADLKCVNMYGNSAKHLNVEMWSDLLKCKIPNRSLKSTTVHWYTENEIIIFLNNVTLNSATIHNFCSQFKVKLVKNILNNKPLKQVTHIVVPKTENNTSDVNFEYLTGIANGIFIVNEDWILDSLKYNILKPCENYEIIGTTSFIDCNGPKLSRINKEKLLPKLFDGISIHLFGDSGWKQFSLKQLKDLIQEFGAKLLKRVPNPEDCPSNIIPFHFRDNEQMCHVSNIILYTKDSNRLIKYNMNHLKAFPIAWFIDAAQKHSIT